MGKKQTENAGNGTEEKKDETKLTIEASVDVSKVQVEAEEKGLDRVLKALGMTKADLDALEAKKKTDQEMIDYDITPIEVRINGQAIPMKGRTTRVQAETIMAIAGTYRDRLMQESLGKEGQAVLRHGTIQSQVVRTTNALGQEVSV